MAGVDNIPVFPFHRCSTSWVWPNGRENDGQR